MAPSYMDLSFIGVNVSRGQETRKGLMSTENEGCEGEWGNVIEHMTSRFKWGVGMEKNGWREGQPKLSM